MTLEPRRTVARLTLERVLFPTVESLPSGVVLDVGAKRAPYRDLVPATEYLTLDIRPESGADIVGDIHDIPRDSATIDTVIATEVLEHCRDTSLALRRRLGPMADMAGRSAALIGAGRAPAGSVRCRVRSRPVARVSDRLFHFAPDEARRLLSPDLAAEVDVWQPVRRSMNWVRVMRRGMGPWVDAQSYLPDDLLTKMDRATMASSVAARSPLLDHRLWEWAATVPRNQLVDRRAGGIPDRARPTAASLLVAIIDCAKMGIGVSLPPGPEPTRGGS